MDNYFDQSNRLDYGSLLYPDSGYKLSFAVGCTYSLDFEALLSVPVYLGAVEQPGSSDIRNPFLLLESIRRSADKIALFCNCDGIKMMRNVQAVFALLENSVFPVNLGPGRNFHPKLWVVRYESLNGEPDMIKIIVLSRNLTFDRSLDLVVEMKGLVKGRRHPHSKQRPIADLLNYLTDICDVRDKADKIKSVADDLMKVETFDLNSDFNDYTFYVTGIPKHENDAEEICSPCRKMMIVSPFLSKSVVADMVRECSWFERNSQVNRVLISRYSSITPDIYDLFDEVYAPIDGLEDNSALEEADDEPKRELHAKVIFKDTYHENALYIGSFNATSNARFKNVELMVKFRYKMYKASLKALKEQLIDSSLSAFQRVNAPDATDEDADSEELTDFTDVISSVLGARVQLNENGSYSTIVWFKSDDSDVWILPLFLNGKRSMKCISTEIIFDHMTLSDLSELFIVKKNDETRVIKIDIEDMPLEERDDAVIRSIIDSKPKFLQFILYLLSDDPELATLELNQLMKSGAGAESEVYLITPSIYEKMLLAAACEPHKIKAIKDIMNHVGEDKVEEDFRKLVDCFDVFVGE